MCLFIESIKCSHGTPKNLSWHQKRVNETFFQFFDFPPIDLSTVLGKLDFPEKGTHKIRILYDTQVREIGITPYTPKKIARLCFVHANDLDYRYKYHNRDQIDHLVKDLQSFEDVVIVKNGLVTDGSYSNLAFYSQDKGWVTPSAPLLNGTRRQQLLKENRISEEEFPLEKVKLFEKVSLINAMLDLEELVISI